MRACRVLEGSAAMAVHAHQGPVLRLLVSKLCIAVQALALHIEQHCVRHGSARCLNLLHARLECGHSRLDLPELPAGH